MREHIPSPAPTSLPTRAAATPAAWATGPARPARRPLGAPGQLGAMWRHLQKTATVASSGGAPAPLALLRAVATVQFLTQRAMVVSAPLAQLPAAVLAGNLLAFTGADVALKLAQANNVDVRRQAALAELLRRPLAPGATAALLGELLGQKVLLGLLQARLDQLRAINEILLAWGEHLRKLAKLGKLAHERDLKASQERARHALRALEGHFVALGEERARMQVASARRSARASGARGADRLVPAWVTGAPLLRTWPNLSQLAALTLPPNYGVRTQGTPRPLPGSRTFAGGL